MPGGLIQLNAYGDQNLILNGNPSLSFFRPRAYRRYHHFAMESISIYPKSVPKTLPPTDVTPVRFKLDHHADMIHDCYLVVPLPNIWSGVNPKSLVSYEFQWTRHLGFNMIHSVSFLVNGIKIVEHTGEYMKLRMQEFDEGKQSVIREMIGHVPELYDPASSFGRGGNYPNAILSRRGTMGMSMGTQDIGEPYNSSELEPSIRGRNLVIPLMFFFCETPTKALPLLLLQNATVEVVVEFRGLLDLWTVLDTRESTDSETVGVRMRPLNTAAPEFDFNQFLSPPLLDGTPSSSSTHWKIQPYMEVNYIFLSSEERRAMAIEGQRSYLYKEVRQLSFDHLVGANQLPLEMFNLITKIIVVPQRNDAIIRNNGFDNYTDWEDPSLRPVRELEGFVDYAGNQTANPYYTAGYSNRARDIIQEMGIVMLGQPALQDKPVEFWKYVQALRSGRSGNFPGVISYSFEAEALDMHQPSGSFNASVIDKTHLKIVLSKPPLPTDDNVPPPLPDGSSASGGPVPIVCNVTTLGLGRNLPLVNNHPNNMYCYTYDLRIYVESYNIMHVIDGTAGPAFAK